MTSLVFLWICRELPRRILSPMEKQNKFTYADKQNKSLFLNTIYSDGDLILDYLLQEPETEDRPQKSLNQKQQVAITLKSSHIFHFGDKICILQTNYMLFSFHLADKSRASSKVYFGRYRIF